MDNLPIQAIQANQPTRRDFLKTTVVTAGGAVLAPAQLVHAASKAAATTTTPAVLARTLAGLLGRLINSKGMPVIKALQGFTIAQVHLRHLVDSTPEPLREAVPADEGWDIVYEESPPLPLWLSKFRSHLAKAKDSANVINKHKIQHSRSLNVAPDLAHAVSDIDISTLNAVYVNFCRTPATKSNLESLLGLLWGKDDPLIPKVLKCDSLSSFGLIEMLQRTESMAREEAYTVVSKLREVKPLLKIFTELRRRNIAVLDRASLEQGVAHMVRMDNLNFSKHDATGLRRDMEFYKQSVTRLDGQLDDHLDKKLDELVTLQTELENLLRLSPQRIWQQLTPQLQRLFGQGYKPKEETTFRYEYEAFSDRLDRVSEQVRAMKPNALYQESFDYGMKEIKALTYIIDKALNKLNQADRRKEDFSSWFFALSRHKAPVNIPPAQRKL